MVESIAKNRKSQKNANEKTKKNEEGPAPNKCLKVICAARLGGHERKTKKQRNYKGKERRPKTKE